MAVTDLGESSILLSTAAAASGWFWISRQRHLALAWLFCIGGCAATMVLLKIAFLACGDLVLNGTVHTPSGHSSMSTIFYGAVALTVQRAPPGGTRHPFLLLGMGAGLALAIGISRVIISAHTPQEVVFGLLVGFAWLGIFAVLLPRDYCLHKPPVIVLSLMGVLYGGLLCMSLAGHHTSAEGILFQVARLLNLRWGVCTA
jgi:membrane-associated phospholipid phosphatase